MKTSLILLISFCLLACQENLSQNHQAAESAESESIRNAFQPSDSLLTLSAFFSELFTHYYPTLQQKHAAAFKRLCESYKLSPDAEGNERKFYEIQFFHDLFTCNSASNGAVGGILQIPYLWHWVTPNPRHQIKYLPSGELLKDIRPPKAFARYNSTADIDRTPALFLKDLATDEPQYTHPACGEFYTFGWCSEREMAFVQLMATYGYTGKVVPAGNHSWSAYLVRMEATDGQSVQMQVSVDNTFDRVDWEPLPKVSKAGWLKDFEAGRLPEWYNRKAHAAAEAAQIREITISQKAMLRIAGQVEEYVR